MRLKQWAENGWLRRHITSVDEIKNLLKIIDRDLRDANKSISDDWRFGIALNAALRLCTILLYASGYKAGKGLVLISAICLAVPHSFRLRHHSATPVWRSLKECGTLQPIFKMAEIRINQAHSVKNEQCAPPFRCLVPHIIAAHPPFFATEHRRQLIFGELAGEIVQRSLKTTNKDRYVLFFIFH